VDHRCRGPRTGRRNDPEMNRGISAVHGLGDTPPLDAPSFWDVAGGRLLAKALQRQSGGRSYRVRTSASRRPVGARHPAAAPGPAKDRRQLAGYPNGLPSVPPAARANPDPSPRTARLAADASAGGAVLPALPARHPCKGSGGGSLDEPSATDPGCGDRSPAGEETSVGRDRSFPSGRRSLRPMMGSGLAAREPSHRWRRQHTG
jgi:hypothetical protein